MEVVVTRDVFNESFTLGSLFVDGVKIGETCEDTDRKLEDGNAKIYGKTSIPRGRYRMQLSFSHHFHKVLPEVLDVPGFSGIRIHGGNTASDSRGCILLGSIRTSNGIARCAGPMGRLIGLMSNVEEYGESIYITIE